MWRGMSTAHIHLHKDAVGADARLARVSQGRGDGAHGRALEVGVGKDHKRSVAAELEGDLLDGLGGPGHELLPDGRGSGEADLPHIARAQEFFP